MLWFARLLLLGGSLLLGKNIFAQAPPTAEQKSQILILENEYVEYITQDTLSLQRLVKHVKLLHDSDTIYCDSAILYKQLNVAEAYGDVLIRQKDGTEALADFMRYTGNNKTVLMRGDVQLSDSKGNELWGSEVTYNLRTKIGTYNNNGILVSEQTMVSSRNAVYNMKTKDARFNGNVIVNDPEYHVVSKDLGYNTDSRIATFFGPSVVTNENSMLQTSNGFYASGDKTSKFWSRTSILNDGQYIEADTLYYTKNTGWANAFGNVIIIDTSEHNSTMYCEYAEYNEITKEMLAYKEPVVKFITEKEVYYYRADTFYSAPIVVPAKELSAQDSIQQTIDELKNSIQQNISQRDEDAVVQDFSIEELLGIPTEDTLQTDTLLEPPAIVLPEATIIGVPNELDGRHRNRADVALMQEAMNTSKVVADTLQQSADKPQSAFLLQDSLEGGGATFYDFPTQKDEEDTTKRFFKGYYNVKLYSDSLQGVSDSMYYNQLDSTITLYKNPLLWSGKNQMKGDIIILLMDSTDLKRITLPKNGIVIVQSGPEQAGFFDQIQGNLIVGYLSNNKIDSLIAENNAMNIYYMKDENDYYTGVNESSSDRIEAIFKAEEIDRIYYRGPTNGLTTPMKEIQPESLKLSRFMWHTEERIKSLEAFLNGKQLADPQLFRWRTQK